MTNALIELGLANKGGAMYVDGWMPAFNWLAAQLLGLVAELPANGDPQARAGSRVALEQARAHLTQTRHSELSRQTAEECLGVARDYLEGVAAYLYGREGELNEAVKVMQGVVAELATEAGEFRRKLEDSTGRLGHLSEVKDIAELRRLLGQEVSRIKSALAEKQQGEEEARRSMSRQIEGLRTKLAQVEEEAALDVLTGVANRRSFDTELKRWVGRVRATGRRFSLALVDIDDFKKINDAHGHPAGDFALGHVGQLLKRNVRSTDFVARYGGEEFAVLLENIELGNAAGKMERVLTQIASEEIRGAASGHAVRLRVTASCGLAECGADESQWDLIMRADGALYEAKRSGKNRVITTW